MLSILLLSLLTSFSAMAQQNLFNAFSGDKTQTDKHFFQSQTNFLNNGEIMMSNTYDYGLNDFFEIGINWFDVPLTAKESPSDKEFFANIQGFYGVTDYLQVSGGLLAGAVTGHDSKVRYGQLLFVNSQWREPRTHSKFVFGLLMGNNNYLSDHLVFQTGVEIPLWHERLNFVADYISGKTENSVGVVGISYFVTPHWPLSLGYQYPSENNGHSNGIVFEITFVQ